VGTLSNPYDCLLLYQVCPERIDMIHKSYRKLCNLLVDVDEWGQVFILNMLTRYARTQFTDPNLNVSTYGQPSTVIKN
jgi:Adaptin N terminal region.